MDPNVIPVLPAFPDLRSAAHVREWESSVMCAKVSKHLRLDYLGVRVIGDSPADKQFIVIGKLPDASPS